MSDDLFIVLRPEGEVKNLARKLQRLINDRYQIYDHQLPLIHVTLAHLQGEVSEEILLSLKEIVRRIVQNSKPVKLSLTGFRCFSVYSQALTLKLKEDKELRELSQRIYQGIIKAGINLTPKFKPEKMEYHVTIASEVFAGNPLSEDDFQKLCLMLEDRVIKAEENSHLLEIWYPFLDPEKAVIETYMLGKELV